MSSLYKRIAPFFVAASLGAGAVVTAPPALALEVPDFEQLVENEGKAVVKVTVTGKTASATPQFNQRQLPPQLRRYFENMPEFQAPPNQPPGNGNRRSAGFGSGFIISEDGYIVTNAHVVNGASEINIALPDRREFIATLVGADERSDIALLKVDAKDLPTVTLGDSSDVNVGQWVLAIGTPFGFDYTATQGIVSAVSRSLPDENYVPFIQTDVAVNPGNSGGPLFDTGGQVVGVNSQIYSRSGGYMGLSFAIPVNVVKSVVDQLKQNGYVSRGWLGVLIQNVDLQLAESFGLDRPVGALVSKVTQNSPAQAAGLKAGDIILSFNGIEVSQSSALPPLVGLVPVGDNVSLRVLRESKRIEFDVTIAELAEDNRIIRSSIENLDDSDDSRLGVVVSELTEEQIQAIGIDGVLLQEVTAGSAAASAGLRGGDVLVQFNQVEVGSVEELTELVKNAPADKPIPVLVHRDNGPVFTALTLQ